MADAEAERVELEEAGALEGEVAAELEARLARLRDEEAAAALQEEEEAAAAEARRAAEAYVASEDEAEAELEFEIDVGRRALHRHLRPGGCRRARAQRTSRAECGGSRRCGERSTATRAFKRVYCMSFHPAGNLLAAAGHGGQAGVFGLSADLSNEDGAASIMSWRPHNSWIGEIQWLSGRGRASDAADHRVQRQDHGPLGLHHVCRRRAHARAQKAPRCPHTISTRAGSSRCTRRAAMWCRRARTAPWCTRALLKAAGG